VIVFHHNDADGRCSAAIAAKWFQRERTAKNKQALGERLEFVEMDYAKPCPIDAIQRGDTVVIVDFSFKPDLMKRVQAATDIGCIWIDHHVTAKDYAYDVTGNRDFSDKGKAACELAWEYFFPRDEMPVGVHYLGDYDAWRLEMIPATFRFYEGMKLEDQSPTGEPWQRILADDYDFFAGVLDRGAAAILYRDNYCADMRKSYGFETEIDGVKAYACNIYRFGSQGFGEAFERYPLCLAYVHDGRRFTVRLYSETVDVSAIAKAHGGGGHKGAAGFTCDVLPFTKGEPCG
jgi:oligoribonuclease NrnB/cAMP/cGMP phosphodiesterase (DHH superfamily)